MKAWLLALMAVAGCKPSEQAPPAATADRPVISRAEVRRGQDACQAYIQRLCACAVSHPEKQQECKLAKSLPEAMQVSLDVAATSDATRRDVLQANDSMRKIVKECIEETAKLDSAGCAP